MGDTPHSALRVSALILFTGGRVKDSPLIKGARSLKDMKSHTPKPGPQLKRLLPVERSRAVSDAIMAAPINAKRKNGKVRKTTTQHEKRFDIQAVIRAHQISCEKSRRLIRQSKLAIQKTEQLLKRSSIIWATWETSKIPRSLDRNGRPAQRR